MVKVVSGQNGEPLASKESVRTFHDTKNHSKYKSESNCNVI